MKKKSAINDPSKTALELVDVALGIDLASLQSLSTPPPITYKQTSMAQIEMSKWKKHHATSSKLKHLNFPQNFRLEKLQKENYHPKRILVHLPPPSSVHFICARTLSSLAGTKALRAGTAVNLE